ncbi:MAG: DNA-binding transcriptional MerR regulator [Lentisphaeria bacterium]|jgi:DNA-binding transcriptional MerR regulator
MSNKIEIYTISDLASEFGITPRTMRFYEDRGLLLPKREGLKRIYSAADRVRLMLILRGRRLGFSLEESKELIALYNPATGNDKQMALFLQKIKEKQESLTKQMRDIKVLQKELKLAEKNCLQAMASGKD